MNIPRLITIPLLLLLSAAISNLVFREVERLMASSLVKANRSGAKEWAQHRTRLIATFIAVNIFFVFADPTLGAFGPFWSQVLRTIVLLSSVTWMLWAWQRDRRTYQRESASTSLRKHLQPLEGQLLELLDGRTIEELSCDEIFTLAKVLPQQKKVNCLGIYREVVAELISSGRVDKPQALLQLEELRTALGLNVEDHFAVIRDLANNDPEFLSLDASKLENRELRLQAAKEQLTIFLENLPEDQNPLSSLTSHQRRRLEEIRRESGLSDNHWSSLMMQYLDAQKTLSIAIERELKSCKSLLESRTSLVKASESEILYKLMVDALDQQLTSVAGALLRLTTSTEPESNLLKDWALLAQWVPKTVIHSLQERGINWVVPEPLPGSGDLKFKLPDVSIVLEDLWQDPDPATASLALLLLHKLEPTLAHAVSLRPRVGLEPAPCLEDQLSNGSELKDVDQILTRLRDAATNGKATEPSLPIGSTNGGTKNKHARTN